METISAKLFEHCCTVAVYPRNKDFLWANTLEGQASWPVETKGLSNLFNNGRQRGSRRLVDESAKKL